MEDNVHEVVRLLIARMESHPEEFHGDTISGPTYAPEGDRWWRAKQAVHEFGTEEEKAAVRTAMRKLMLNVAHEWMMDELLNGEERRREWREKEEQALSRAATLQQAALLQQQNYSNQQLQQLKAYSNQLTGTVPTTTLANSGVSENLIERLKKKGWV